MDPLSICVGAVAAPIIGRTLVRWFGWNKSAPSAPPDTGAVLQKFLEVVSKDFAFKVEDIVRSALLGSRFEDAQEMVRTANEHMRLYTMGGCRNEEHLWKAKDKAIRAHSIWMEYLYQTLIKECKISRICDHTKAEAFSAENDRKEKVLLGGFQILQSVAANNLLILQACMEKPPKVTITVDPAIDPAVAMTAAIAAEKESYRTLIRERCWEYGKCAAALKGLPNFGRFVYITETITIGSLPAPAQFESGWHVIRAAAVAEYHDAHRYRLKLRPVYWLERLSDFRDSEDGLYQSYEISIISDKVNSKVSGRFFSCINDVIEDWQDLYALWQPAPDLAPTEEESASYSEPDLSEACNKYGVSFLEEHRRRVQHYEEIKKRLARYKSAIPGSREHYSSGYVSDPDKYDPGEYDLEKYKKEDEEAPLPCAIM